jgi:hypothetical protein
MGTVRRPQRGHPRVMWWRMSDCLRRRSSPCPVSTCPDVQRSGVQGVRWIRVRVHVSGDGCAGVRSTVVRCPRVSCPPPLSASALAAPWWVRGASWSRGQTALGRPGGGRPRTTNHARVATTGAVGHLAAWQSNPPGSPRPGSPVTAGGGGTRLVPTQAGWASLVREDCMASYQTLNSEWIGCGDYAQ